MARKEEMASTNEALKWSITIHEDSSKEELFENIKGAKESLARFQSSNPKIQRVHDMLRDHPKFEIHYEPRALAIGPFHHYKPRCHLAKKFKLALAAKFIEDSGREAEDLHKIIEDNIKTLKDCYDEEATRSYTDEALTELLFLDGCSTLQFIYCFMNNELADFKIQRDQVAFAEQDLFLVENQLPYKVLKLLMSSSDKEEVLDNAIQDFVTRNIPRVHKHKHRTVRLQGGTSITMEEPTHLLDLLRTEMLGPQIAEASNYKARYRQQIWQSFRNIQELKAAGILVKPSKTSTLRDIYFDSRCFVGFLHLPPISVDYSMGPKFLNLIAYEMCPDFENDFGVTSYICILDSLIDREDDVKELRSAGVLRTLHGSDQEVADLFNEIGTDLVPNSEAYRWVRTKLEMHYETKWKTFFFFWSITKWKTWMAEFWHDHFSSPWTILAFLGVLAALGFGSIQTWYTIKPPPSACDTVCDYLKKQLKIE